MGERGGRFDRVDAGAAGNHVIMYVCMQLFAIRQHQSDRGCTRAQARGATPPELRRVACTTSHGLRAYVRRVYARVLVPLNLYYMLRVHTYIYIPRPTTACPRRSSAVAAVAVWHSGAYMLNITAHYIIYVCIYVCKDLAAPAHARTRALHVYEILLLCFMWAPQMLHGAR